MKFRRIISLTAGFSFVLMVLTSIVLYIVPQGRVAYWSDWTLWGLSKTEWTSIHINVGLLFLISLLLHLYYNWKQIVAYMKNKARQLRILTSEFQIALLVTIVVALGTYFTVPPFSWVLDFNEAVKETAARKYSEPPYGHAELSILKSFANKTQLDLRESMRNLRNAGIRLEGENQTVKEIAARNRLTPQQLFRLMKPEDKAPSKGVTLPDSPPPGTGNRTLNDLCREYGLDIQVVLKGLDDRHVTASGEMTFKEIAQAHQVGPMEIYDAVREVAASAEGGIGAD